MKRAIALAAAVCCALPLPAAASPTLPRPSPGAPDPSFSPRPNPSFTITVWPLRIKQVRVTFPGPRKAVVRWGKAPNATSYQVLVRRIPERKRLRRDTLKRVIRLKVRPRQRYVIRVRGVNDAGPGPATTRRFTVPG